MIHSKHEIRDLIVGGRCDHLAGPGDPHSTAPILIHKVDPVYTSEAVAAKLQGTVILSAIVGTDGIPSDIHVVRGLGKGLDENAVECLQAWRFKPATNHGEPVSTKVTVEINFRLPQNDVK